MAARVRSPPKTRTGATAAWCRARWRAQFATGGHQRVSGRGGGTLLNYLMRRRFALRLSQMNHAVECDKPPVALSFGRLRRIARRILPFRKGLRQGFARRCEHAALG